MASSGKYEIEISLLESNGISVEISSSHHAGFYAEDRFSGYIQYNIKHYAVNGFCFGQMIKGDEYVGKLVWMGRYLHDPSDKSSIFAGLELVSLNTVKFLSIVVKILVSSSSSETLLHVCLLHTYSPALVKCRLYYYCS